MVVCGLTLFVKLEKKSNGGDLVVRVAAIPYQ